MCYEETLFNKYNCYNDINTLQAFKATIDADTLYYH